MYKEMQKVNNPQMPISLFKKLTDISKSSINTGENRQEQEKRFWQQILCIILILEGCNIESRWL